MLLTLSTTHAPASDLGYLLHKHPDRCQSFDLAFGVAHVFYPQVDGEWSSLHFLGSAVFAGELVRRAGVTAVWGCWDAGILEKDPPRA